MPDENSPLLQTQQPQEQADRQGHGHFDPANSGDHIPKLKLFVLAFTRAMEPVTYFSIFAYANKQIWKTGDIPKSDTGFYSGLIESLFSLCQLLAMPLFNSIAKRFGRKPCIVVAMLGLGVSVGLFGFCTKIWQMALSRCAAGLFSSYVVSVRLMFWGISTPATRARVFSFWSLSNNMGQLIGPFIGGLLSEPTEQFPSVFGRIQLFEQFPFALPSMAAGAMVLLGMFALALLFEEDESKSEVKPDGEKMSYIQILKYPGVSPAIFIYFYTILVAIAYTAVSPAFWFTDVQAGGYGFEPLLISVFLALGGTSQAFWTIFAYPPWEAKIGRYALLQSCFLGWPVYFLMHPINNLLRRNGHEAAFWVFAIMTTFLGNATAMMFSAVQVLLHDVATTDQLLDVVNIIAIMVLSSVRTIGPGAFTSFYALCTKMQLLHGYLFWIFMALLPFADILVLRSIRWVYYPREEPERQV